MIDIYEAIFARLATVPGLKWCDIDKGQLDKYTERPAVDFPCALVTIVVAQAEDISSNEQQCTGTLTVRCGFNASPSRTGSKPTALNAARSASLSILSIIDDVYSALQGYECDVFSRLSRTGQDTELREDELFVSVITFDIDFIQAI